MTILLLTTQENIKIVKNLTNLGKTIEKYKFLSIHANGFEYHSLMQCFLLHNISIAESLLGLIKIFSLKWFPIIVGYILDRSLFETEVTAHYITLKPKEYSKLYISYNSVLKKKEMDVRLKHKDSPDSQWKEAIDFEWKNYWKNKRSEINVKYNQIKNQFKDPNKWSGKSIYQMAKEVKHEEAYDIFYSRLSSFAHPTIRTADQYLKVDQIGPKWSLYSEEEDVGYVFRYAASFLDCFLKLHSKEFGIWKEKDVDDCWKI